VSFSEQTDFDALRGRFRGNPVCSVCNLPKRSNDEIVFRGPLIHMEGFFDVCQTCIVDAAQKVGMILADKAEALEQRAVEAEESAAHFADQNRALVEAHTAILGEVYADLRGADALEAELVASDEVPT